MAGLVSEHQIAAFSDPQNGQDGDATVVLGNDNSIVTAYDAHDADGTIHVQSSALASRSPAGTLGRKWMTVDSTTVRLFYDNGSSWLELNAIGVPLTVTSTTASQFTVAYDGSNKVAVDVSSAGVVSLSASGASAAFAFNAALSVLTGSIVASNGEISARTSSGSGSPKFSLHQTTTERAYIEYNNGASELRIDSDGSMALRTNNANALTIDASQQVAVVGLLTGSAGVTVASGQTLTLTGATVAGAPTWSSGQTFPTVTTPHVIGSGSAPGIAAGAQAGSGASVAISGTDLSGQITINTGTGNGVGVQATVTFATAFAAAPKAVILTPGNTAAAGYMGTGSGAMALVQQSAISTTQFTVNNVNTALGDSQTFIFYYTVIA